VCGQTFVCVCVCVCVSEMNITKQQGITVCVDRLFVYVCVCV